MPAWDDPPGRKCVLGTVVRIGVLILFIGGGVEAQPSHPPTAYDLFKASIEFAALDCDTEARTGRVRLEFNAIGRRAAEAAWNKCVAAAKAAASRTLPAALLQLEQNAEAQSLLKVYHARWLAHLGTTGLELSQSDLARSLKIEESGRAAEDARTRFEREAGLN